VLNLTYQQRQAQLRQQRHDNAIAAFTEEPEGWTTCTRCRELVFEDENCEECTCVCESCHAVVWQDEAIDRDAAGCGTFTVCPSCEGFEPLCSRCNGSGEGMYDGSTCSSCGGSGVAGGGRAARRRAAREEDVDVLIDQAKDRELEDRS